MRLQIKPNAWSCFATAFAMALNISVAQFFKLLGHDGGEIVCPQYPDPYRRAGIHPQEAVDVAWGLYKSATPFELNPVAVNFGDFLNPREIKFAEGNEARFRHAGLHGVGVIECLTANNGGHAVAFCYGDILDPDGHEYTWDGMAERGLRPIRLWKITQR